ncbi:MAG: sugar phosphate isomerase/epimerase [Thermoprotei archaeon]|nr:MAG: sugar phosphate isomerase/epimerase [Thermoprotei archaeon]
MFAVNVRRRDLDAYCIYTFPWKIGIVAFMANPAFLRGEQVRETLETLASDPFFDVIELSPLKPEHWKVAEEVKENTGVEYALGAQPIIVIQGENPNALDEPTRKKAVNALKKAVDDAAAHGIKKFAFCSGPDPGAEKREKAKNALIESIREIVEYAGDRDVYVILETFDREWDKKLLIGPLDEAIEVAKIIRKDFSNFGILWDLSHAPMLGEKPEDLKKFAPYLAHIHVGCTKKLADGSLRDWHPGFYRPGAINGVKEVADLVKVLHEIGYRGALGFEVKPEEGQTWLEVVHAAKGVLYTAYANYVSKLR